MSVATAELAVLTGLAAQRGCAPPRALLQTLRAAGIGDATEAVERAVARGWVRLDTDGLRLTSEGGATLLSTCAQLEAALDNSPTTAAQDECPSIPWLTSVQTEWIDAISLNYAVETEALARLLPAPLSPEVFHGTGWVQVLMSSLRDMRPQGLGALFGVNFYQVSYRAAVRYVGVDGSAHRGGYFVRSESNHALMRTVGNTLVEFKFHEFGAAEMMLLRDGARLTAAVDAERDHGRIVGIFDTTPVPAPPPGSVWPSLEALQTPLVECYDAYGVDRAGGWLYTLTIDREPWNARFATPMDLFCEYFESGPLASHARLDSVLHIPRCGYRWRPLRREPLPS